MHDVAPKARVRHIFQIPCGGHGDRHGSALSVKTPMLYGVVMGVSQSLGKSIP